MTHKGCMPPLSVRKGGPTSSWDFSVRTLVCMSILSLSLSLSGRGRERDRKHLHTINRGRVMAAGLSLGCGLCVGSARSCLLYWLDLSRRVGTPYEGCHLNLGVTLPLYIFMSSQ